MATVEKVRLTKSSVEKLAVPATGERLVWDRDLSGFGVRISSRSRRTYFIYARTSAGRQVKLKVGVHGAVTAERAREIAAVELGKLAAGGDPAAERAAAKANEAKRRATLTVSQLCDKYLAEYAKVHKRPSSIANDKGMIEKIIKPKLGTKRVPDVEQDHITALHRDLRNTPYQANRVLALLSKMFSLSIRPWKMRLDNPAVGVKRYDEERRQRYLGTPELGRLADALAAHPHKVAANALRMLLLTGARRGEVLGMTWQQVEREPGIWIKPSSHTKQKREHRVPLSPGALDLIEQMGRYRKSGDEHVFPGRVPGQPLIEIRNAWAAVTKAAGIDGVRIHDLRHSYASLLAASGASLPIIGALLGHTQPGTTARYAHLADDPLREATARVSRQLAGIAEKRHGADVVPLRKA